MHSHAPGHVTCRLLFPTISAIVSRNNHKIVYLYKYAIIYPVTYARLRGSKIFSTFDLRSGYHHMGLSLEARAKSAFVTPMDKFEFTRCPFGLSQVPAYFQRLINKVIKGLPFALG